MAQIPRMNETPKNENGVVVKDQPNTRALSISGLLLGAGLGGFLYSILFHHIFQTSFMLSNRFIPDTAMSTQINIYYDGVLLIGTWVATVLGVALLWAVARRNDLPLLKKTFGGSILLGWGLFNLFEGLISHHMLQIHHIVQFETPANQLIYDYFYLGSAVLLIALGAWLRTMDWNRVVVKRPTRRVPEYAPI